MELTDYERCRSIWQRVSPELEPYPEAAEPGGPAPAVPAGEERLRQLQELIEEELAERRVYQAAARCAPHAAARRLMGQLAAQEAGHARRLAALYYMACGRCYQPTLLAQAPPAQPWCTLLRQRCQRELWAGRQYAQLAREGEDAALRRLLEELAADEERHARCLLRLLEQNILAF